ncbi:hypothetical protein [Pontibacter flavimaris]|uniref:MFS transporter n=1 Tax=Pontibacter flavimaris TaxID=1797110 RepID=A0A1Q5P8M3_9BACT|nr:hypothetical protein [Pontibacter flavimaris]OKL38531.1 hypothetical protein A3841_05080 [Pontibacter flavimaris]
MEYVLNVTGNKTVAFSYLKTKLNQHFELWNIFGAGSAMVYPNFLAVVAENTHPVQRPQSLGIFRFWRDFGYVAGAVAAGVFSDLFGLGTVIIGTAMLTV